MTKDLTQGNLTRKGYTISCVTYIAVIEAFLLNLMTLINNRRVFISSSCSIWIALLAIVYYK